MWQILGAMPITCALKVSAIIAVSLFGWGEVRLSLFSPAFCSQEFLVAPSCFLVLYWLELFLENVFSAVPRAVRREMLALGRRPSQ